MPTCGNCGKSVATSDVTCPHCGVLLAAYASPEGSGGASIYEPPPPPPSAEIPSVEMDVKPPSEAEVVTDPAQVAEEAVSTAPRPLFDTYLTVEEIAKAAEGDHVEDVVMVPEGKIPVKSVEFEVPDYAKPPADAAPIPTVDEDNPDIPLITHDQAPDRSVPAKPTGDDDDDEPEPEPEPVGESWLQSQSTRTARPARPARPSRPASPPPAPTQEPEGSVGQTDDYLRKLHQTTGYSSGEAAISRPVEERRPSPAERTRNRRTTPAFGQPSAEASEQSSQMGCSVLYVLVLATLWISTFISVMSGNFSLFLIFVTFAATWGFGPVRKFVRDMQRR